MSVEKPLVNFLFTLFKTSASHVGLPHCFYFLEAMFFTKLVKALVNIVEPLTKLLACKHLHNCIKFCNIAK
jgi:hypothetical protein